MQRFLLIIDTKLSTYLDLTLNQTVIRSFKKKINLCLCQSFKYIYIYVKSLLSEMFSCFSVHHIQNFRGIIKYITK